MHFPCWSAPHVVRKPVICLSPCLWNLSIFFCSRELGQEESKRSRLTRGRPWVMAFVFGLLHGLGFAGALLDIGIANNKMLLSLFFFNVGIEIAQIALIPIPLLILFLSKKFNVTEISKISVSICVGGMGFYWFIDRVIGIFL